MSFFVNIYIYIYIDCIEKLIKYGYSIIKFKTKTSYKAEKLKFNCTIHKQTIQWLGFKAFYDVLTKKNTSFKIIIKFLIKELSDAQYTKTIHYLKHHIQNSNDEDITHILDY